MENHQVNEQEESYYFQQNETDNNEGEPIYIVADDQNNYENYEGIALTDDGNGNYIQVQDTNNITIDETSESPYIVYDGQGNAYLVGEQQPEESTSFQNTATDQINYRCPSCPRQDQNANAFTKHMREKHYVKVFTCRQCHEFFENLSLLFLHARREHVDSKKPQRNPGNYKFHCELCTYMTNNGGTMEHHRRAHTGDKPFVCDICNKKFAQKANMKTHRNRHIHKDRIFRCDTCQKSFNSHDIYLAHLRTREHELQEHFQMVVTKNSSIKCLGCNEIFESSFHVNKHARNCEILKSLEDKFMCCECSSNFKNSTDLKNHLKTHRTNRPITCPVCGERGFPGFNQLNHHITRAHALKVNRRNVCRYCEMTFEHKEKLDQHIEEMHFAEKNARQSRGAAGRLRCRYEDCKFTSNSVMLMDRHHEQHLNNTLPSSKPKRGRKKKEPIKFEIKEETNAVEFEDFQSGAEGIDVLRDSCLSSPTPEQDVVEQVEDTTFDDTKQIDDAMMLSIAKDIFAQNSSANRTPRQRKAPSKYNDFDIKLDNEDYFK